MTDSDTIPDIRGKDRLTVEIDGETREVFNHVSVSAHHYVNSVNGHETFESDIAAGDMGDGPPPEAVTERVAEYLWVEWSIDVEAFGIDVIDVSDPEVSVA